MAAPRTLTRMAGILALAILLLSPTPGRSQQEPTATGAAREPLARRPYRIRAWIVADPAARLDGHGLDSLTSRFRGLVRRFVGTPWDLEISESAVPTIALDPEDLDPAMVAPLAEGFDKAWIIRIEPSRAGVGYEFSGREVDLTTGLLGPLRRRAAPSPSDAARELLRLALGIFNPLAEVGPAAGGGQSITVQGAALEPADAIGKVVDVGSVFLPLRVFEKPDGSTLRQVSIPWSYLRVDSIEGASARCSIVSSLPDPLTRRVIGKSRLLALGIKPSTEPTRLRFLTKPDLRPAAGYLLTVRNVPDGSPRPVGTTDREGRIELPPEIGGGLVVVRLLAGRIEPLVEFPIMPGETAEERVLRVNPLPQAVALEMRLNSLRDEIVDVVASRARLAYLMEARVNGEAWDELRTLLDQFRALPSRESFERRLDQIEEEGRHQQEEARVPVLTRTAQAVLAETKSLIAGFLDDAQFQDYADVLNRAQAPAPPTARPKSAPAKPIATPRSPSRPPPRPAPEGPTPF